MDYSIYLHIPFCSRRCAYCDFNTYAGQSSLIPAYVDALVREIKSVAYSSPTRMVAHTIFLGGGTPSLLTPKQFGKIFKTIRENFSLSPNTEISLEANPGTVTQDSLRKLHHAGLNRLSFGMQSAHPQELRQLERIHDFYDVIRSVKWARQAGFENLNLDLIFGLPEQTLTRWQSSIQNAVELAPEHLSLYALTVEHGTPFGHWVARGLMPLPDPDLAADMYQWASDYLARQGFEQYEISNWSKHGYQCRHNLQYWRNQPYLGFGAGAHGYAKNIRVANILRIKPYIERCRLPISKQPFPASPATVHHTSISTKATMQETMITGLRLTNEGVSVLEFRQRFGCDIMEVFGRDVKELLGLRLLEWSCLNGNAQVLRLTPRGRLLGNQVFMRFVN